MLRFSPNPGAVRHETLGVTVGSTALTTVTCGNSSTYGSYASVGTTGFDWHWIVLALLAPSAVAEYTFNLAADDGSGNKYIIAPDLRLFANKQALNWGLHIPLPLYVKSGTPLYLNGACSLTTGTNTTTAALIGSSAGPMGAPGHARCVALYTKSGSIGATLDAGASANTKPSYTQLSAGVSQRVTGLLGLSGQNSQAAQNSNGFLLDIGVGGAGAETTLVPNFFSFAESVIDYHAPYIQGPFWCDIPPSTRIAARIQSSTVNAGPRTMDLALYGFVP